MQTATAERSLPEFDSVSSADLLQGIPPALNDPERFSFPGLFCRCSRQDRFWLGGKDTSEFPCSQPAYASEFPTGLDWLLVQEQAGNLVEQHHPQNVHHRRNQRVGHDCRVHPQSAEQQRK